MTNRDIRLVCQEDDASVIEIVDILHGRLFDPAKPSRNEAILAAALGARLVDAAISNDARWVAHALLRGLAPSAAAGSWFELKDATIADRLHEDARLGPGRRQLVDAGIVQMVETGKRSARYHFPSQLTPLAMYSLGLPLLGLRRLSDDQAFGRWHVLAYARVVQMFQGARNPSGGPHVALIRSVFHRDLGAMIGCDPDDAEILIGDLVNAGSLEFSTWSLAPSVPPADATVAAAS